MSTSDTFEESERNCYTIFNQYRLLFADCLDLDLATYFFANFQHVTDDFEMDGKVMAQNESDSDSQKSNTD